MIKRYADQVGGDPITNAGESVPTCGWCNSALTFYMNVDVSNVISGHSISVFVCSDCNDDDTWLPSTPGVDPGISDLNGKGKHYEFRVIKNKYVHHGLARLKACQSKGVINHGKKRWFNIPRDHSGKNINGRPLTYLFQVMPNQRFEQVIGSMPQIMYNIIERTEYPRGDGLNELFLGLSIYVYGIIFDNDMSLLLDFQKD